MARSHTVVMVAGVLVLASLSAAAAQSKVRVFGDRFHHPADPTEFARTYVDMPKDHDGDTAPLAVGIQFTPGFVRRSDDLPLSAYRITNIPRDLNLTLPGIGHFFVPKQAFNESWFDSPSLSFPKVGRNPFTFSSFTYNYAGHVPVGVYDIQHYDIRAFMVDEDWWWTEEYPESSRLPDAQGGCENTKPEYFYKSQIPVPVQCFPGSPYDIVNIGAYDWGIGSHLYNLREHAWELWAGGSGVGNINSLSWGLQDGQIAFVENMVSREDLTTPDIKQCTDFPELVPKRFNTERLFPTRKCVIAGSSYVKVEFSNFVTVPGGCEELRDGPLAGYTVVPPLLQMVFGPQCKGPLPSASSTVAGSDISSGGR